MISLGRILNMNSLLLNIKNLFPYLILISIYFFFVNLEARKELNIKEPINRIKERNTKKTYNKDSNLRISIPVIPYK